MHCRGDYLQRGGVRNEQRQVAGIKDGSADLRFWKVIVFLRFREEQRISI